MPSDNAALPIIVMGVSGAGKSTIGSRLAKKLGARFRDADEFHPQANVAKMASGQPLNDEDRRPWLAAIAAWLKACGEAGQPALVTCSALKRAYRDELRNGAGQLRFVFLKGPFEVIAERVARRRNHFMPPALLRSQFDALEEPGGDELALVVDATLPPGRIVRELAEELSA